MLGKEVLFPFSFHCTGMPIAAAATKLKREIEKYGNPPQFPKEEEQASTSKSAKAPQGKGKQQKKKSKFKYQWDIMKEFGVPEDKIAEFQEFEVWFRYFPIVDKQHLKTFGLRADFRRSFITTETNPYYDKFIQWQFNLLKQRGYVKFGIRPTVFCPVSKQACADHDRVGAGEGVKPQQYTLIKLQIDPEFAPPVLKAQNIEEDPLACYFKQGKKVYLVAGTLRPETMVGQTNCWILPRGDYCVVQSKQEDQLLVCSEQSAINMSYQKLVACKEEGKPEILSRIVGFHLIGRKLFAPTSVYPEIYTLPLLTISMNKATGVVTSVPSDAPDDAQALIDIQKDANLRKKYYVTEEMVKFEPQPIIKISNFRYSETINKTLIEEELKEMTCPAPYLCKKFKVKNQKDAVKLKKIKDICYKLGFNRGVMDMGPHKGLSVKDAKGKIRADMIKKDQAYDYWETEKEVMSRIGGRCVVKHLDQWYLSYGSEELKDKETGKSWKQTIVDHVTHNLETYNPSSTKMYFDSVDWLSQWACSRSFGAGTRLPFDKKYVIESLSDSTIYMAYYTIAHILQKGVVDGDIEKIQKICKEEGKPENFIHYEKLTDEFFNYIYLDVEPKNDLGISKDLLAKMKENFKYFYPMDMRVSGKDLIQNHLIMSLYNHAAVWGEKNLCRSYFTNGHVTLDNIKMSKSMGNFLTLIDSINKYSASATRMALGEVGDGLQEGNYGAVLQLSGESDKKFAQRQKKDVVNQCILKLIRVSHFVKEFVEIKKNAAGDVKELAKHFRLEDEKQDNEPKEDKAEEAERRKRNSIYFLDCVLENTLNAVVARTHSAYQKMKIKAAVANSFHILDSSRTKYLASLALLDEKPNYRIFCELIRVFLLINSPIVPHFCENLWQIFYHGNEGLIVNQLWPECADEDKTLTAKDVFVHSFASAVVVGFKSATRSATKFAAKKKLPIVYPNMCYVGLKTTYSEKEKQILTILTKGFDSDAFTFDIPDLVSKIQELCPFELPADKKKIKAAQQKYKKELSNLIKFAKSTMESVSDTQDSSLLSAEQPYDQKALILENLTIILCGNELTKKYEKKDVVLVDLSFPDKDVDPKLVAVMQRSAQVGRPCVLHQYKKEHEKN